MFPRANAVTFTARQRASGSGVRNTRTRKREPGAASASAGTQAPSRTTLCDNTIGVPYHRRSTAAPVAALLPDPVRPRERRHVSHVIKLTVGLLLVALAACASGEPDLEVGAAQAAEPVSGASQVVLDVTNNGDGDDYLNEVTTPAAVAVDIHRTEIDDGRATMTELDGIEVPAGETVQFRPGSLHLMLIVPDETVQLGGTFELTLDFEQSEDVTVEAEVVEILDLVESEDDLDLLEDPQAAED